MEPTHQQAQIADGTFQVVIERIGSLHSDVDEMKSAMRDLTTAIVKLALVEERQSQSTLQLANCNTRIATVESRLSVLEIAAPINKQASLWVMTAVWGAAGILALIVLKAVGVI